MDTKLKNRHKLAIVLILLMIAIPTMAVLSGYPAYSRECENLQNELDEAALCSSDFLEEFYGIGCGNVKGRERAGA